MVVDGLRDHVRGALVVFVTTSDEADAERIAGVLVEERLAACVNIVGGIRSVYRWEGKVTTDREQLLIIKTFADRFDALKEKVLEEHTYDLPEIVALPIESGHHAYLDWLLQETR
jgi:periplasmic divalent cation tolerance protein